MEQSSCYSAVNNVGLCHPESIFTLDSLALCKIHPPTPQARSVESMSHYLMENCVNDGLVLKYKKPIKNCKEPKYSQLFLIYLYRML